MHADVADFVRFAQYRRRIVERWPSGELKIVILAAIERELEQYAKTTVTNASDHLR